MKKLSSKRILGEVHGQRPGPTIVIFSGIHGNEMAGVHASKRVLENFEEQRLQCAGQLYFVLGNLKGMEEKVRFLEVDLNRIWTRDKMRLIEEESPLINTETKEQIEIYDAIKSIVAKHDSPFYFIDLHTTSSPSVPFITISDSLNNRAFSSHFPIPVVLGIEEYLEGPLLTFINDHGHIAIGFEGGQHDDPQSITNCEAFIWKSLKHAGFLLGPETEFLKGFQRHFESLCCAYQFFAIHYRHGLNGSHQVQMKPGFNNFEPIEKGQKLGTQNNTQLLAADSGRIFMPLYQTQGEEAYFILHPVSAFWLKASEIARKWQVHHFLRSIPGVKKDPDNPYALVVNPKVARFLAKQIFHLFGYRQQIFKDDKLHFIRRDRAVSPLP